MKSFDWKSIWTSLLAIIVALAVWFVQNEAAAIGFLVLLLTSGLSLFMQWKGYKLGKFWAQITVTLLAFILGGLKFYAEIDGKVPPLPVCTDPVTCVTEVVTWLSTISVYFDRVVVISVAFYNLIWAKIQDYIADSVLKLSKG